MKTYIIAEIGPNHNGSFKTAMRYVDLISKTGADAIKFQLANPMKVYSRDSFKAKYQKKNDGKRSIIEMSKKNQLTQKNHKDLSLYAKKKGIDYLCSAFDTSSLDFLIKKINIKYIKIPSGEVYDLNTIKYLSKIKKPFFISTGMVTTSDLKEVLKILNKNFKKEITLLYCVSNYPASLDSINFNQMLSLKKLGYPIGFSDHTTSLNTPLVAVTKGAKVIEKHVTINKKLKGPDHKISIDISEFSELVKNIREVDKILLKKKFSKLSMQTKEIIKVARKSIVSKKFIPKNTKIMATDITFKRPGIGINPLSLKNILGKYAKQDIELDKVIKFEMIKKK